jgi:hypothetical protein
MASAYGVAHERARPAAAAWSPEKKRTKSDECTSASDMRSVRASAAECASRRGAGSGVGRTGT